MSAVRTSYEEDQYTLGGNNWVLQTRRHHAASVKPPVLFFPEHANTVLGVMDQSQDYYGYLLRDLAEDFTVCAATPGGSLHWGNANARGNAINLKNYLQTAYGTSGKVGLVATSMGSLLALNFAMENPTLVSWVACMLPALNLADLKANSGYASEINAAYSGNYTDATFGATSSPYYYRTSYPAATIPTAFFTASDDAIALPVWADAFIAAQPTVYRESVGALGHTAAGIAAAALPLKAWVRRQAPVITTGAQYAYPGAAGPLPVPVLESTSNGSTGSNLSATITMPSGTQAGDLLIMALAGSRGAGAATTTMAGWTKIAEAFSAAGTSAVISIWAKIAGAAEGSALWQIASGNTTKGWICQRWSGAAGLPAVQTPVTNTTGGTQTMVSNTVTPSVLNSAVVTYLGLRTVSSGVDPIWGGGATAQWNTDSGQIGTIYSGYEEADTTDPVTHTVQFTNNQGAPGQGLVSLIIEPAA